MVAGHHTAWRCKKCGEVFFRLHEAGGLLSNIKSMLGLLTCPKCGSRDVTEDKCVRT